MANKPKSRYKLLNLIDCKDWWKELLHHPLRLVTRFGLVGVLTTIIVAGRHLDVQEFYTLFLNVAVALQ
jgi:hypothetical protein